MYFKNVDQAVHFMLQLQENKPSSSSPDLLLETDIRIYCNQTGVDCSSSKRGRMVYIRLQAGNSYHQETVITTSFPYPNAFTVDVCLRECWVVPCKSKVLLKLAVWCSQNALEILSTGESRSLCGLCHRPCLLTCVWLEEDQCYGKLWLKGVSRFSP